MKMNTATGMDLGYFASLKVLERVQLIDEVYGEEAIQLSSMQKTSGVIMHMIHRLNASIRIVFIDTQFHFSQTLELRDAFIRRYGLSIDTVRPEASPLEQREKYGVELSRYVDGQPLCCYLRKEVPLITAKERYQFKAMVNGLMRTEGGARREIEPVALDPHLDCRVFHPLFDWTLADVEHYTLKHDLPTHPLYEQGYASIGCMPCTTPIRPGESPRAGRWRHLQADRGDKPTYCGVNFSDGARKENLATVR